MERTLLLYVDGRLFRTLKGDGIVAEFLEILEEYVARRYPVRRSEGQTVSRGA